MRALSLQPLCATGDEPPWLGSRSQPGDWEHQLRHSGRVLGERGQLVAVLIKRALSPAAGQAAYRAVVNRIGLNDNRGTASGFRRHRRINQDGTVSRQNVTTGKVRSVMMGFSDRSARFPFCRCTGFNVQHPAAYQACLPALREADAAYRAHAPGHHAAQAQVVARTHPAWVVPGTVFTTVTLNKNFQTAYHRDAGDLPEGFGVMSCLSAGRWAGGQLVLPRYRLAVALESLDVVLFDPHEVHGTAAIRPLTRDWVRITLVHYYRRHMWRCGAPAAEFAQAAAHDGRQQRPLRLALPQGSPGELSPPAGAGQA